MGMYSAVAAAREAGELLKGGKEPLSAIWRHTLVQLLDVYESRLRHGGVDAAGRLFDEAPERTGDTRVDAAFAALAEHLARRDDWPVPPWVREPSRSTDVWWFVSELPGMHPWALRESPLSFRRRGVFITANALERV